MEIEDLKKSRAHSLSNTLSASHPSTSLTQSTPSPVMPKQIPSKASTPTSLITTAFEKVDEDTETVTEPVCT